MHCFVCVDARSLLTYRALNPLAPLAPESLKLTMGTLEPNTVLGRFSRFLF